MRNWRFRPSTVPFALLAYCVISFGLLIPWLGFYWDDWPSIYYLHVLGPRGFIDAFAVDPNTGVVVHAHFVNHGGIDARLANFRSALALVEQPGTLVDAQCALA